jgi:hypothetical protein
MAKRPRMPHTSRRTARQSGTTSLSVLQAKRSSKALLLVEVQVDALGVDLLQKPNQMLQAAA